LTTPTSVEPQAQVAPHWQVSPQLQPQPRWPAGLPQLDFSHAQAFFSLFFMLVSG
jgi:hypothetical protein